MENRALAISLPDRPQRAIWVTSVRMQPDPPSLLILSQTSAGKDADYANAYSSSSVELSSRLRGRLVDASRLEGADMKENAPGDARQFVGERDCQYIVVQPSFGSLDPGFEPV